MEWFNIYSGILFNFGFLAVLISLLAVIFVGYLGSPLIIWSALTLGLLIGWGVSLPIVMVMVVILLIFNTPPIRQLLISSPLMKIMKALNFIPKISETERTALEAGVVWSEAELFSGKPNFKKMMDQPYPKLTDEEQAFIDGPCEKLCQIIDDWEIYKNKAIPEDVFNFIREKGFLGMIIPKKYGGLGFSAFGHSEVIMKISTRSIASSITVMVPNSLGPAELLIHYGTERQKKYYLPRLAKGEDLPCFALTEPQAGSDAGSISSEGILFKGEDGKIYIRINWRKRWITLAAISTVIGLAFRLRDPDNLLGRGEDLGITCALIPSKAPGVELGKRHNPLGIPFYNCPTLGKNVVVDAEESIIGGLANAGKGWGMLMESLGVGRGISLPSQSTGGAKMSARVVSSHSYIRKQFGLPICKFEGIEEPLARITSASYFLEAMRCYTISALDQGIKPPVVTAIAKYNMTEIFRQNINDAMDILGGAGISLGPRNTLGLTYMSAPISITVEGANILTRTLIIFGQGALRAHPYAFREINAIEKNDSKEFDKAFWGHIGHIVRNTFRSFVLSVTRGYFVRTPFSGKANDYAKKLAWTSASFAIMSDIAMGVLGGKLKVKEKITGRFADILSWMYIATCVLKRYEVEGCRKEDLPLLKYSMEVAFSQIQKSFDGIFANFDVPIIGLFFKKPIKWWSMLNTIGQGPKDDLSHQLSKIITQDGEQRDRLTNGIFIPKNSEEAMGRLEKAFKAIQKSESIEKKIKKAIRSKRLPKKHIAELLDEALEKNIINQDEHSRIKESENLRWDAIQVDEFTEEEYHS